MQRHTSQPVSLRLVFAAAVGLVAGLGVGCGGPVAPPPTPKPFAGTALTVACPDPAFAKELSGRCAAWAARTGATVKVLPQAPADTADVAVIRPPELGAFAARGELGRAPGRPARPDPPAPVGADRVGLPVRDPRVGRRGGRAAAGRRRVRPGLPVRPADRGAGHLGGRGRGSRHALRRRQAEPAAPAGRPAPAARPVPTRRGLLRPPGRLRRRPPGRPERTGRCTSAPIPGQRGWRRPRSPPPPTGSTARTSSGRPATATRWRRWRRAPRRWRCCLWPTSPGCRVRAARSPRSTGWHPLPGTRTYFDAAGKPVRAGPAGNFVPFLGFGGQVGVVFKRSPGAAAAWDLLAELASPSAGLAILNNPALGAGPYRIEHTEPCGLARVRLRRRPERRPGPGDGAATWG